MRDAADSFSGDDPRSVQEAEYEFPYHYIPAIRGSRVVHNVGMDWAADYLNGIALVESVMSHVRPTRICDVGCGDGRLINDLAPRYPNVRFEGIDFSERALALAEVFRNGHPNARFRQVDVATPPADLLNQDLVTLIEVFEHIPPEDADDFLRAAFALVKPGGTLLITVPHTNVPVHSKHFRHFSGASLRSAIQSAIPGAEEVHIRFMGRLERGWLRLASKLAHNRFFSIEPLMQWRLRRRLGLDFVAESEAQKVVAQLTRATS